MSLTAADEGAVRTGSAVARLRTVAWSIGLVVLAFSQSPGLIARDTKVDLVVDPGGLLSRSLHLWQPLQEFGTLEDQSYGYLFPMGPFFALGRLVSLPPWVVQRAWWAVLLVVAFVGLRRLAAELGLGSEGTRTLAALAYALSPRVLTTLGAISSEALPLCLAPWVLVPLVRGRRGLVATALLTAALVLTQAWFPARYWDYADDGHLAWVVLLRDLVLVGLLFTLAAPSRLELHR